MRFFLLLLISMCLIGGPCRSIFYGQEIDLAQLQKDEAERRKKTPKSKMRYLDTATPESKKDEDKDKPKTEVNQITAASETNVNSPGHEATDEKQKKEYWQTLKKDIDDRLQKLNTAIDKNQSELNRLQTEFYIKSSVALEQAKIKDEMDKVRTQLGKDKEELKAAQEEKEKLYTRARKESIPPGWLR